MNEPKQPDDPDTDQGVSPAHDPAGNTPNGVPDGTDEHDAKGVPNSDRQKSETAAKP